MYISTNDYKDLNELSGLCGIRFAQALDELDAAISRKERASGLPPLPRRPIVLMHKMRDVGGNWTKYTFRNVAGKKFNLTIKDNKIIQSDMAGQMLAIALEQI